MRITTSSWTMVVVDARTSGTWFSTDVVFGSGRLNSRLLVGQSSNYSDGGISRERWKVSQGYVRWSTTLRRRRCVAGPRSHPHDFLMWKNWLGACTSTAWLEEIRPRTSENIHNFTSQLSRFTFIGLDLAPPKVGTFAMTQLSRVSL